MNKQKALEIVNDEIIACKICPVGKSGRPVVGEGSVDAEVVFIGEAPGKQEAVTGKPFIGRSGKLLRSLIAEIGLDENDIYITSPVKYLPDRGTPTTQDIAHGRLHLMKQLAIIQPKVVVLLGRVAAEGVLQKKVAVSTEHGKVIAESFDLVYPEQSRRAQDKPVKYFLTVHPAAALRFSVKYKPIIQNDFQKLKSLLN